MKVLSEIFYSSYVSVHTGGIILQITAHWSQVEKAWVTLLFLKWKPGIPLKRISEQLQRHMTQASLTETREHDSQPRLE